MPVLQVAPVHLEPDGVLRLAPALLLRQRDHHRAVHLLVVGVGVAQVDEELRVRGVGPLQGGRNREGRKKTKLTNFSHLVTPGHT